MTTRKLAAPFAALLLLAGCATPGPLHVYSLPQAGGSEIRDDGPSPANAVPSFLAPDQAVTGFAYDPFTDHFFLRLAPGNRIRVVDRPARAVKREFTVEELPAGGGDLAVRPRDGHLFFTLSHEAALIETTRFGEFVRRIVLPRASTGVAFDSARNRLFSLGADQVAVTVLGQDAAVITTIVLARQVVPGALGYDSEHRELYAPLAGADVVGVFGEDGRLRRTLPLGAVLLDVGPRSFLRMF